MNFEFNPFEDLSSDELYEILQLRAEVFVVEQNCIYNDLDSLDKDAIHQFVKMGNKIVAYSRLLKPGTRFSEYSIGRVIVVQNYRGKGIGENMMKKAKNFLVNKLGAVKIKISAQKYLQKFYEDLEFRVVTKDYLEDGIPHIGMLYRKN